MEDNRRAYYEAIARSGNRTLGRDVAGNAASQVGEIIATMLRREGTTVGHVFVICAEPGMGKTSAVSHVLNSLDSRANRTKYIDLTTNGPAGATSRMVKTCRDMARMKTDDNVVTLAFDNVPSSDESEVQKQARAIRKLAQAGCNVVLSMLPEAEPLLEELPDAILYGSRDLVLTRYSPGNGIGPQDETIALFTHGIPRLVRAVQFVPQSRLSRLDSDGRYLSSLARVVEESIRPTLIDEERELRFAMIELGSGSISDLDKALGDVDPSLLEAVSQDAPFFGLDLVSGTFSCAGVSTVDGIRGCMQALQRTGSGFERVSEGVSALLVMKGEYERAGVVVALCGARSRAEIVLGHAAEFVNAGCRGVVEDCVRLAAEAGETTDIADARLVISCVVDAEHEFDEMRHHVRGEDISQATSLFLSLRDALAGGAIPKDPPQGRGYDVTRKGLETALYGIDLMSRFMFPDAFSFLLGAPERLSGPSVSSSIIWMEYTLAIYLSGSTPTPEDGEGFRRATYFAAGSGVPFLSLGLAAVGPVASVLVGRSDHEPLLETCIQRSAYMGNKLLQAVCLMVAAIADQRIGTGARAYVRLGQAAELATACRARHLLAACHILQCATKSALGERVVAGELLDGSMPPRLGMVARAVAVVVDRSEGARLGLMGEIREDACPEGLVWLVNTLVNDFGSLSARLRNVVPRSWVEQVERVSDSVGVLLSRSDATADATSEPDILDDSYEVEVSLLGGFHVAVNGVPVPEARFERRRAKSLLALLGAIEGHRARRFEVMETVWPEYDFHDAKQRVYEATSVLRGELTTKLGQTDVDPLISNRGASTIELNPECTRCDVDEFEGLARRALGEPKGHARDVLSMCAQIEQVYHGDLFVPSVDGAAIIEQRRQQLRDLYTDAMVLASTSALAVGRAPLAVHYAKVACTSDPLREDAEIALVRALGVSGRRVDAERSYQEFAERIVGGMKRPPSRELRDAYREVMEGTEGGSSHVEDVTFDGDEGHPDVPEDDVDQP